MRPRDRGPDPVPVEPRAYFSQAEIDRADDYPRAAALDLPRADGDRARRARAVRATAAPAAHRPAAAAGGRRGDRGGDLRRRARRAAPARRRLARAGQGRRPGHAGLGGLRGRRAQGAARSARRSPAPAARCSSSACAGSATAGGWPARSSSSPTARSPPTPARSCSTRSSTTSRSCRPASCAATCSSWPSAAGVDAGEVYEIDASRRTTAANAYVAGVGRDQAGRHLRQPDQGLHAGRDAAASWRTSSATRTTTTCATGCIWVAIVAPPGDVGARGADRAGSAATRRRRRARCPPSRSASPSSCR